MAQNHGSNPRPRQEWPTREGDTAADTLLHSQDDGGQAPADDSSGCFAPHPAQQPAVDAMALMRQMFEFMSTAQRQSQEQMP
ncbi:hypothetical protein PI124_g17525 [Phytophthora idaei]|nr:hypothetical protein PI125_g18101 [Phytophthora idaei]KAG3138725.1 hypothetical protein PI126_g16781 [Phytophthora idaei]KAG3237487.1 hypothetical protein PI124_g17525 [Phytophthora idaei]